jgi:hypothetical protein
LDRGAEALRGLTLVEFFFRFRPSSCCI